MKVRELIKALEKCDQDAEVYTEGCNSNETLMVVEYNKENSSDKAVYVGDDMYYVDDALLPKYSKKVIEEIA